MERTSPRWVLAVTATASLMVALDALIVSAALGDRFGRRRVFIAGLALFAGASAWCVLAPSIGALIAARALQGVGAAATMPLALLGQAFPPERRAGPLAVYSSVTAFGALAVAVLAAFGDRTSSAHFTAGFAPAMTGLALLSLAAAWAAAALPGRRKPAAVATAKARATDAA